VGFPFVLQFFVISMNTSQPSQSDSITNHDDPVTAEVTDIDWARIGVPVRPPFTMRLAVNDSHMGSIIRHVPNTEYIRWVEVLSMRHSDALGYDGQWYKKHNRIWYIRRHEIDYLAEVLCGDDLVMATWIGEDSPVTVHRHSVVYRPADACVVCRAVTVWVLVSRDSRRPIRIDDEMRRRFLSHDIVSM